MTSHDGAIAKLKSGKASKSGPNRKDLKAQVGNTCVLYSMKRLATFKEGENIKDSKAYQAYKLIKSALKEISNAGTDADFDKLAKRMEQACEMLGIDIGSTIKESYKPLNLPPNIVESLARYHSNDNKTKCLILYNKLLENIFPTFGLVASTWCPANGLEALKKELINSGAVMFIGKYGRMFYGPQGVGRHPDHDTDSRKAYFFKKASFKPNSFWSHAIVVDQIKKVNGIDMVFFRDPNDPSKIGQKEKVYMLSYESFCKRINHFSCSNEKIFGYHTKLNP